jgi:hypothetical protein
VVVPVVVVVVVHEAAGVVHYVMLQGLELACGWRGTPQAPGASTGQTLLEPGWTNTRVGSSSSSSSRDLLLAAGTVDSWQTLPGRSGSVVQRGVAWQQQVLHGAVH